MGPSEIKATFFNGQPFTASSPGGTSYKMTFTPDGKMTRESLAQSGSKTSGTWKLNAKGFCTSWNHATQNCFTVVPLSDNKWSIRKIATTISVSVAVWSK
jgi:YD repeat-containing protein